ncbi:unnamed protein product [Ectocarpus sp. 12 AP-2014]
MVISLTTRKHVGSQRTGSNPSAWASPAKDVSLLFDLMPDFVSEEEAAHFETLEEGSEEALRRDAWELTVALARCFRFPRLDSSNENKINRHTLKKSLGRRSKAFTEAIAHGSRHFEPNPSNTAVLAPPGYGEQSFLSVSGTETVFSLQTWRDWLEGDTEGGDNADDDGQENGGGAATRVRGGASRRRRTGSRGFWRPTLPFSSLIGWWSRSGKCTGFRQGRKDFGVLLPLSVEEAAPPKWTNPSAGLCSGLSTSSTRRGSRF